MPYFCSSAVQVRPMQSISAMPRLLYKQGHLALGARQAVWLLLCMPRAVSICCQDVGTSNHPCACGGAASFAYFLGTITSLVASGNLAAARVAAEKVRIDGFLRARRIPAHLAGRVRAHHLAQLHRDLEQEERDLVQGGPITR